MIGETARVISWAPLTTRFSWDAPSLWGQIRLIH
jgi:hypothetical protein